jgi:CRP-like cAMP-binding protein/rhodanese-related sulfurtransferase
VHTHKELAALAQSHLFKSLPWEKLADIRNASLSKIFQPHELIFNQEEPGDSFYIIHYGKVRIYRKTSSDITQELATLGPGESFGELSLITGEPRFGYAEALEETEITIIRKDLFEQLLKEYPHIVSTLIKKVSGWLYSSNRQCDCEADRQYMETQALMNKLDKLYMASSWLHSNLDFNTVLSDLTDTIISLIGAKSIAIFLVGKLGDELVPVKSADMDLNSIPKVKIGSGILGEAAKTGKQYIVESLPETAFYADVNKPLACIPLKIKDHVIGLIAIYSLYIKKSAFTQKDRENFQLLAHHAAIAIFTSRAYSIEKKTRNLSRYHFLIILGISLVFSIVYNLSNPHGIKLLPASLFAEHIPATDVITARDKQLHGKVIFVDAMPANFYEQEHIKGAMNIPLSLFDVMYEMDLSGTEKDVEIIVYGRTISHHYDKELAMRLILLGHKNTTILEGGLSLWKKSDFPVETGGSRIRS